jgi:tRNA-binding protein
MIFTYNKEQVGDVLMVIVAEDKGQAVQFERKGQVARVFLEETGKTVAWNIFDVSSLIEIAGNGQVFLTDEQVATLNAALAKEALLKAWSTTMFQSS